MLITVRAFDGAMARAEQIVTDRKTTREMVVFMEEAVKEHVSSWVSKYQLAIKDTRGIFGTAFFRTKRPSGNG
jgi:hypothetical protein